MKEKLIMWVVTLLLEKLSSEEIKEWADKGLDLVEDKVKDSVSTYDDMVVLPLINVIRTAFSIEDDD